MILAVVLLAGVILWMIFGLEIPLMLPFAAGYGAAAIAHDIVKLWRRWS